MAAATPLLSHFPNLGWKHDSTPETFSTGVPPVDSLIEGCPRGRVTEITGPLSSGRTSLLYSILAEASRLGEFSALVDGSNAFDPASAVAAGVQLHRLVWVRCGGNAEAAMRSADLLIHSGGFGVIALDLCEIPLRALHRIPISSWYRFRRAVENTPCALVLLNREPQARACSSLAIEMKRARADFSGTTPVLEKAEFEARPRKPAPSGAALFLAESPDIGGE